MLRFVVASKNQKFGSLQNLRSSVRPPHFATRAFSVAQQKQKTVFGGNGLNNCSNVTKLFSTPLITGINLKRNASTETKTPEDTIKELNQIIDSLSQSAGKIDPTTVPPPEPQISFFDTIGFHPVNMVIQGLEWIHATTGLPWWAVIAGSVIAMRTALLPITAASIRNSIKMGNVAPQMQELSAQFRQAKVQGDKLLAEKLQMEMVGFFKSKGVNPFKGIGYALAQAPVFILLFLALRDPAYLDPALQTEGLLWFKNLAVADPYYGLPILNGLSLIAAFEIGADMPAARQNLKKMRPFYIVIAGAMLYFTYTLPASVHIFWLLQTLLSVSITYMLKHNSACRKLFNIPKVIDHTPKAAEVPPVTFAQRTKPKL